MNTKIITILIIVVVFTAGLVVGFGNYVFAGDPVPGLDISIQGIPGGKTSPESYNISLSNKSTVAKINEGVGNILIRHGIDGAVINQVTDALAGGVYKAELRSFLIGIGIGEEGVNAIFAKLDELGAGTTTGEAIAVPAIEKEVISTPATGADVLKEPTESPKAISTPDTGDTTQGVEEMEIAVEQIKRSGVSTSDTGDVPQSATAVNSGLELVKSEVFIGVIASNANLTKTEVGRVINALMAVSPTFIIDEDGLPEKMNKAELVEAIASGANLTKPAAERALDAFVSATSKSLKGDDRVALVGFGSFSISKRKARTGRITYQNITLKRSVFQDVSKNIIQNIRVTAPEEREKLKEELRVSRQEFRGEIQVLQENIRDNAKGLRDNFRENVRTVIGHVDHGKTVRIAIAHANGLRMSYRFRSAMVRFEHIIGKLESRVGKLSARGVDMSSVTPLIEEAKNMSVGNEAKLEVLKAKYEELLAGENLVGIGKEAREIAKELKTETQNLHAKLREIVDEIKNNIGIGEEGVN